MSTLTSNACHQVTPGITSSNLSFSPKKISRKSTFFFGLWLMWAAIILPHAQGNPVPSHGLKETTTLKQPFTLISGNDSIASRSSRSGPQDTVLLGGEPAIFTLKDGRLSSEDYVWGTRQLDRSLNSRKVSWIPIPRSDGYEWRFTAIIDEVSGPLKLDSPKYTSTLAPKYTWSIKR